MKWKILSLLGLLALLSSGCKAIPPETLPANWAVASVLQVSESKLERLPNMPLVIVEGDRANEIRQEIVTDQSGLACGPLLGIGTGSDSYLAADYYIVFEQDGQEMGRQPGIAHVIEPALFSLSEGKYKLEDKK